MSTLTHLDDYAIWIAAVVAGMGALGWLGRKTWRGIRAARAFARKVDAVLELAGHQLSNNGGESLLDYVQQTKALAVRNAADTAAMTMVVDSISDNVDVLTERFESHLGARDEAERGMWPAVEAIAKATPPE